MKLPFEIRGALRNPGMISATFLGVLALAVVLWLAGCGGDKGGGPTGPNPTTQLVMKLEWTAAGDLDLSATTPNGTVSTKVAVADPNCTHSGDNLGTGTGPFAETITCSDPAAGSYTITIDNASANPIDYTLSVTKDGSPLSGFPVANSVAGGVQASIPFTYTALSPLPKTVTFLLEATDTTAARYAGYYYVTTADHTYLEMIEPACFLFGIGFARNFPNGPDCTGDVTPSYPVLYSSDGQNTIPDASHYPCDDPNDPADDSFAQVNTGGGCLNDGFADGRFWYGGVGFDFFGQANDTLNLGLDQLTCPGNPDEAFNEGRRYLAGQYGDSLARWFATTPSGDVGGPLRFWPYRYPCP